MSSVLGTATWGATLFGVPILTSTGSQLMLDQAIVVSLDREFSDELSEWGRVSLG